MIGREYTNSGGTASGLARSPRRLDDVARMRSPRAITVLYFAAVREAAGKSEERFELPDDVGTVTALSAHLERVHPALRGRLGGVRYAINETFVHETARIEPGDVVAVIPPVSGG